MVSATDTTPPQASSSSSSGQRLQLNQDAMDSSHQEKNTAALGFNGSEDLHETRTMAQLREDAHAATNKEKNMTLREGLRLYPKAIAWSMLISSCIIMEGYDVALISNFYAFPQFRERFGDLLEDGTYQVSAPWQAGLSNGVIIGEMIGLFAMGWIADRIGYRYTIMGCLVALSGFVAIAFTAKNVQTLLVAEILCGIPWGAFQTLTVSYAAEVCPIALRGYLTTWVNSCWGIGQLISIGVIRSRLDVPGDIAWRLPFALQWMWPAPLIIGIFLAPESPWWLVRKGRSDQARRSILRLASPHKNPDFDADETLAMMQHTTALEKEITSGSSYLDCFRGHDRRRTEIVCMVWAIQNLCGNAFSNYSTYFFQQAGLSNEDSYNFALGQYALNTVAVFAAWGLMSRGVGRRTLYIFGLCGLATVLFVTGFMRLVPDRHTAGLATGSLLLGWAVIYQCSVGTVCYSLVGELSSRRLMVKTVVIGRNCYNLVGIFTGVITPYMLNPDAWNLQQYSAFFWAGGAALCAVYTYFRVPEPTGRSFSELDLLFEKGVSARKFSSTSVDLWSLPEGEQVARLHSPEEKHAVGHLERT